MQGNVSTGQLVTIRFGAMGIPTLADAEAGYEMDLTNVRNPYANAGLPIAGVNVNLFRVNGSVWYTGTSPLPEIVPNNLTGSTVKFALMNPAAGIQTDVLVDLTTLGWVPIDGRIEVTFPQGFTLTSGSTVAIQQTNLGERNAVVVTALSETERTVTLTLAGTLGFPVKPLPPLVEGSFRLTKIRNPYSGFTGTFRVRTFSGSNDVIDSGTAASV